MGGGVPWDMTLSLDELNWLAHILQPAGATPRYDNIDEDLLCLKVEEFLDTVYSNFYAPLPYRREVAERIGQIKQQLIEADTLEEAFAPLRQYCEHLPWMALLIPSGQEPRSDQLLTSSELLQELVAIENPNPGFILQPGVAPSKALILEQYFPAFQVALANTTRWPGVLLWKPSGEAAFFELPTPPRRTRDQLHWIFTQLGQAHPVPAFESLQSDYAERFPPAFDRPPVPPLRILHVSDLHVGSEEARLRMPRVQRLLRSLVNDLGTHAPVVPIITGDLLDSPSDDNLDAARSFMEFVSGLGTEEPVVVLGNHDVREDGWGRAQFEQALYLPQAPVRWIEKCAVGLLCFNSVRGGNLARGWVGEREMAEIGNALDRKAAAGEDATLIALLHHHPIPVEQPKTYAPIWLKQTSKALAAKSEELIDAPAFLRWVHARGVAAVLHGHKHVPRFNLHNEIPIIACGSTVGKVPIKDVGTTYMSVNLITIDTASGQLSCRLLAELVPGGGLEEMDHQEIVYREPLVRHRSGLFSALRRMIRPPQ
jgi:predicted phosphodiesterase